ncbi:palmitoyltransferase ZDHHC20-like isoform X2 [Coccinella septempunctata]|uniref:palmitoyltransferase ZDHHC20-like isoform X2 n=1 Tax=Coccinella septempunctata TaxID=41139 RepID=UPI001D062DB9|nr:palmitoyltransferase ZDHHC20-like isoform X2 [Coccinella septempunctata]XP_044749147.1 palmitoyltransferase ZDHHC20-like isoform X2 [Coccinella septempunctata]
MKNDKPRNAMPCLKKCIQAVPSALLITLIAWTYYTYIVEFCIIELRKHTTRQTICLTIGNAFFLMFTWCYLHVLCCKTNYRIPNEFKLSAVEHDRLLYLTPQKQSEVLEQYAQNRHLTLWLRTADNLIRYCMKCHQIKPDRAHHCSSCESCVLKMDHHCPWTNNCVGFANQKSFMLMLTYGTLACLFYSIAVIEYYLHVGYVKPNIHTGFICSGFVTSMVFVVGMSVMLQEQVYNLLKKNETILESFQRRKQTVQFEDHRFTFNLGYTGNFLDCFGRDAWKWFFPMSSAHHGGYNYRVRHKKYMANMA